MNELDKIHIKKYMVILRDFMDYKLSAKDFSQQFLNIRRKDQYLFDGYYDVKIESVLSTIFLHVDHYCDPALADYDKSNPDHDITAEELYLLVKELYEQLQSL
jgi:hypothetical protein